MIDVPLLPNAPSWFRKALNVPVTDNVVPVSGANIHYLAWGERGRRGLVFVHGGAANAHWWSHIAATFAEDYRVIALDLSGHGDSDRRSTYELERWTEEVVAVAVHGGVEGKAVVVGHSMGGFVTIATAALHPDELAGVIICDSPVTSPDPEVSAHSNRDAFGKARTYDSFETAVGRFRAVPAQKIQLDYIMDHIARHSVTEVDGGWRYKFDPSIFQSFGNGMRQIARPYLSQITCRFALLRSQYGLVTRGIGKEMYEALGRVAPVIELPQAGHHPMLDQPLVLLTALRSLLADWDHSNPLEAAATRSAVSHSDVMVGNTRDP